MREGDRESIPVLPSRRGLEECGQFYTQKVRALDKEDVIACAWLYLDIFYSYNLFLSHNFFFLHSTGILIQATTRRVVLYRLFRLCWLLMKLQAYFLPQMQVKNPQCRKWCIIKVPSSTLCPDDTYCTLPFNLSLSSKPYQSCLMQYPIVLISVTFLLGSLTFKCIGVSSLFCFLLFAIW